jgi:large subunit ribosomal protein L20
MSRVKAGTTTRFRHKKILKRAKGYFGRRKNTFKVANQAVEKLVNMLIETEKLKKDNLEVYGFRE